MAEDYSHKTNYRRRTMSCLPLARYVAIVALLVATLLIPAPTQSVVQGIGPLEVSAQTAVNPHYQYDVIATADPTGANRLGLVSIDPHVSINDNGKVAFVGRLTSGQGIFVGDAPDTVRNITPGRVRSTVTFGPSVQINNLNHVIAREEVAAAAGVPRTQYLRVWDGNAGASDSILQPVANSNSSTDPSPSYQTVYSYAGISNHDQVVYSAYDSGYTWLEPGYSDAPGFPAYRPQITDDGRVVAREGNTQSSPIRVFSSSREDIACGTGACLHPGFSQLGQMPGVSGSGALVAFAGNRGNGPGIFASIDDGAEKRALITVAGETWNGITCARPELGTDPNGHSLCFQDIAVDSRVAALHCEAGACDSFVVSFLATPSGMSGTVPPAFLNGKALWTVRVDVDQTPNAPNPLIIHQPQKVAQLTDFFSGRKVTDLAIYDQIAAVGSNGPLPGEHRVAFWASTDSGDIVVRATLRGPELQAASSSIPADNGSTTTVTLSSAPAGHKVRLLSSLPGSTLSPKNGTVGSDGGFTTAIRSSAAGTAVITARDLTTGTAVEPSTSVTFTAVGGATQPPPAQVGDIVITDVKGACGQINCPKDGFFMLGLDGLHLPLLAVVDWKGRPCGTVEFTLNGHTDVVSAGTRYDLDINQRLREGSNVLHVVARSNGEFSQSFDLNLQGYRLPQWIMDGVNALPTIGDQALVLEIAFPGQPLCKHKQGGPKQECEEFNFGFLPGDLNHFQWQTNIKMTLPTQGGAFEVEVSRERDKAKTGRKPKAFLKLIGHEFDLEYHGKLSGVLGPETPYVVVQELGIGGSISREFNEDVGIPEALNALPPFGPPAYVALSAVPQVRDWLNDRAKLYVKITPKLSGDFTLAFQPAFHVADAQIGLDFPVRLGAQADLWVVEGHIYGGLGGKGTFGYSDDDVRIASVKAYGYGGYKFRLAGFSLEDRGDWKLAEWPSGSGQMALTFASAATEPLEWQLIGHAPATDYAAFRVQLNKRQAFAPRSSQIEPLGLSAATAITSVLVSNVYTYTEPFLAVNPTTDNALLLWVHDDIAKPVGQAQEIEFSRWDGSAWSAPAGVTNDDKLDGAPQVAWTGDGKGLAIWQRLNDTLPITATFDITTAKKIEIATAMYDPLAGTWTPVALLTNNAALDMTPQLARNGAGGVLAAWRQNDAGLLSGTITDTDRIVTAFYGSGWSTPKTAADGIPGLVDLAAGYGDGAATVAFTRYLASTGSVTPTLQLFTTAWDGAAWSAPVQHTDDNLGHTDPQVVYNAANEPLVVWLAGRGKGQGQALSLRNLTTGQAVTLTLPAETGTIDEFRVVQDAAGNIAAIFTAQASQRDLFVAFYDQAHDLWGNPVRLTDDTASESYPAPALDASGRLLMGYSATAIVPVTRTTTDPNSGEVITYTLPTEGQTDLVTLSHTFVRNLSLAPSDLAVSDDHPAPGSSVTVSATVHNTVDLALDGVAIEFYDGDPAAGGTLISKRSLSTPLAAGLTATLTTSYSVPTTGGVRKLYAVADPADVITEANEADNTATLSVFGPDLVIEAASVEPWGGSDVGLVTVIRNLGTTASPATTLAFYRDTITGTLAVSDEVPTLAASGVITLTTPWNYGSLAEGRHELAAAVNPGQLDFTEVVTANNTAELTLDVLPDLSVSPLYLWGVPLPDGRMAITVSVANFGSVAAPASQVDIYVDGVFTDSARLTTLAVPTLDPAGQATLETTWDPTRPGEHTVYAVVNPDRAIAETTWANNVASTAGAAPLSDLAASRSGNDILLTWTHMGSSVTRYAVWRSTNPNFVPGGDGSEKRGEALPPDSGTQASYVDGGALKTSGTRYFYVVLPISASGIAYPVSNRVGVFNNFDLFLPLVMR